MRLLLALCLLLETHGTRPVEFKLKGLGVAIEREEINRRARVELR